jgi:signal transduction histidine kinase
VALRASSPQGAKSCVLLRYDGLFAGRARHTEVRLPWGDDGASAPPYHWVVNRELHDVRVIDTARDGAHSTWRGLVEVLTGTDPPLMLRSRAQRRTVTLLTVLGAMLVALAVTGVIFALYRITAPGFSVLQINSTIHGRQTSTGRVSFVGPRKIAAVASLQTVQILLGAGALLLSVRRSLTVWRFVFVLALIGPFIPRFGLGPFIPWQSASESAQLILVAAIFCVAGYRHSRAAIWWMWAFMLVPVWLWFGPGWEKPAVGSLVLTAVAEALDALGSSQRARRALVAQFARTELEEARRAVLEERTRIARELHDVVAHHMSLIAVQAETAPYRIDDLPLSALTEFSSVSAHAQAREALSDMRRLLGVLRSDEPAERTPQPQLHDVPELVAVTRRVGVVVDLSMPEQQRTVPSGVGLCAYRIVQEAITNACRHAPGSPVSVTVRDDDDALRLRVSNGPGTLSQAPAASRRLGHGLAGMRERVNLLGGSLSAEPSSDGGFAVSAVLPFKPVLTSPSL